MQLEAGETLDLVVEQKGVVDLELLLYDNQDVLVRRVDSREGPGGIEPLPITAGIASSFQLLIRPFRSGELSKVRPSLRALRRLATPDDRRRSTAEQAYWKANQALKELRYDAAIRHAEIAQNQFSQTTNDRGRLADVAYFKGLAYSRMFHLDAAQRELENAASAYALQHRNLLSADSLNTLGHVLGLQGKFQEAKGVLHRAYLLQQDLGHTRGMAVASHNLGKIYAQSEVYDHALQFYDQAEKLYLELGDQLSRARSLSTVADLLLAMADSQGARAIYCDGIRALRESRASGPVADSLEANLLAGLGIALYRSGNKHPAAPLLDFSQSVFAVLGNSQMEATLEHNLAWLDLQDQNYNRALLGFKKAQSLFDQIEDATGEAGAWIHLGNIALDTSDDAESAQDALQSFERALELASQHERSDIRIESLAGQARAQERLGNLEDALRLNSKALQVVETQRSKPPTLISKAELLANYHPIYERQVRLLLKISEDSGRRNEHWKLALVASETSRSRSLLDSLARSEMDLSDGASPQIRRLITESSNELDRLATRRQALLRRSTRHETEIWVEHLLDTESELRLAQAAHFRAQALARGNHPLVRQSEEKTAQHLAALQADLPPSTTLLIYSIGREHGFLWKVTRNQLAGFSLSDHEQISPLVRQIRQQLPHLHPSVSPWPPPSAEKLSELLLGPVAQYLADQRLWIVVEDALHYLPFEVLPHPHPEIHAPLGVRHEIAYLPSIGVMMQLRQRCGDVASSPSVAVIADPIYLDDSRLRQTESSDRPDSTDRLELSRLRYTTREARAIVDMSGQIPTKIALGAEANRSLVLSGELSTYRILHFATHGVHDTEYALGSSLVLSMFDGEGAPVANPLLPAREIYDLEFNADLVVLSACETGLGREMRGEGLVGLPHGFFHAGAAQVLVSSWAVDDAATADLMTSFYRSLLQDGLTVPAALLRARQQAWQRQDARSYPHYWGAFRLLGDCTGTKKLDSN